MSGELDRKDERRVTTMLRLSGLPPGKTLEDFNWSFQPHVDRRQIETLATCSFIREKTNVLFLGPPGVGKSHLAAALGVRAIKNGFSVTHFVLDDLMHALRADAAVPPARLRAKRYFNSALLIIDEVGFRPIDRTEANLFFRLVSARYERGSIVLTSNKHVRDWPAVFADDEILTTAILDRLLHHVQVLAHRRAELPASGTQCAPRAAARLADTHPALGPEVAHHPEPHHPSAGICLFTNCGNLGVLAHLASVGRPPRRRAVRART